MKTAKMMQDFNWLCTLDVNHKLLLILIIEAVYLCTLHNKIISPAHFIVYVLWWPTPTWFSNIQWNGHSLERTPHYTGQNVVLWIEFALRIILYSSPECRHLAILYYGRVIKSQRS